MRLWNKKTNIKGVSVGISALILAAFAILFLEPANWWIEMIVLILLSIGLYLIIGWVTGKRKMTLLAILLIVGNLVLKRLEMWEIVSSALLLLVLILIGLIN
jgi:hypothetical protein